MVIVRGKLRDVSPASLERFVTQACRAAGVGAEVDVLITSSAEVRRLNRQFCGKNQATDVLSFPSLDGATGDIAISADVAERNARQLGHALRDELKVLILHGLLHLAGHDHEADNGQMARKEVRLRRALHLPTALIERTVLSPQSRARAGKRRRP
jgi:probable rRNA maturation factor